MLALAAASGLALPGFGQGVGDDPLDFWAQATLYRDEWGTPHVYGDNPRALAFAFGYAQADDHLEAMLMAYRVANGRAAEVLGESWADSDELALKMGHAALAEAALASGLDPMTIDLCEGFALGVNAWLVDHPDGVPEWADGVKPADILALMHCFLMSMAPCDLPGVFRRAPASDTGNAWALAPERTPEGNAILVINPHGAYDGPFRWYEAHLVSGAIGLNVAGATLFGLPVILQGHNAQLGWALTPNRPDFADVYAEPPASMPRRDPKNPAMPLINEETMKFLAVAAHTKPYYVRTAEGVVQRTVPCLTTSHGPVIGQDKGRFCAFQIGGYRDFGGLAQCVEMGRAQSLGDFQTALEMQQLPCFHIVYADRDGNIFYAYNAKVFEKRLFLEDPPQNDEEPSIPPTPIDWQRPLPGENPTFAWAYPIPMSGLPYVLNPESGYIQACGNPPWTVTGGSYLNPKDWPAWLATDRDTYRAQRVRQLLGMGARSFRDSQSMLYDVLAPAAAATVPRLFEAANNRPDYMANAHPDLAAGLELLDKWNYTADTGAEGMTFFHTWWAALYAQDPQAFASDDDLFAALALNTPQSQTLALDAATAAARVLRNEHDALAVPWGKVHVIQRGEREEPIGGGAAGEPIFVAAAPAYDHGRWPVTYGYGFAMVVEFGDWPQAVSMVPFGASEDPKSPHFGDQLDLMLERRFKVTRFTDADVQRNAYSARGRFLYLRPKGMDAGFTFRTPSPIEARLYTAFDPPEPLPDGLAPFTVYVGPEYVPHDVPASIEMAIAIPETLCAQDRLAELAVYAYEAETGWRPLNTRRDPALPRTLLAADTIPHVYAVLGPEACLESADAPVVVESPPPPRPKVKRASMAKTPPLAAAPSSEDNPLTRLLSGEDKPDGEGPNPLQPRRIAPGKWEQPVPWANGPKPPMFELDIDPHSPYAPQVAPPPSPKAEPKAKSGPGDEPVKRGVRRNFSFRKKP